MKTLTLDAILEWAFDLRYFHPNDDGITPIPYFHKPGSSRLVVAVGPNASGKSFFRRIVREICREHDVECMGVSMQGRTASGVAWRGLIYGAEEWQSTGVNSSRTVTTGILTCRERTSSHVIFWDEPDIGLSDSYAAGTGHSIAEFARSMPDKTVAAFVVTHSKALVRQLTQVNPHYIHFGVDDPPRTLSAWLKDNPKMQRIEDLQEASHRRHGLIQQILNETKKKRS